MIREGTKNISYNKKESFLEIRNYDIRFESGSHITVIDVFDAAAEVIHALQPDREVDVIDLTQVGKILLLNCNIKFEKLDPFNSTVKFQNCSFENDIVIGSRNNEIRYILDHLENYYIEFGGTNSISFKNTDIIFSVRSHQEIKMKHIKDENVEIMRNGVNIHNVVGKMKLLDVDSLNFNISSSRECLIKMFSSANNLEVNDLEIKRNDIFAKNSEKSEDKLKIQGIKMKRFFIKDLFLKLYVKDVNFFDVSICFEGERASLDISTLQSIATIWNPRKIIYRGFCHNEKKDTNLKEIDILAAQEFFSEMKKFFSDKGNGVMASYFYASEMEAHKTYLVKKYPWRLHYEFIIAWSSRISSNFNQNWFRAFVVYICVGAVFAIIFYFLDTTRGSLLNSTDAWCAYLANIYSPLTIKFEKIEELVYVHSWVNFLWIFWKVIAGYLIYQMIVSSRKFVRF